MRVCKQQCGCDTQRTTPPNTLAAAVLRFACDLSVVASQRSFITVNEEEIKQLNRSHRLHINTLRSRSPIYYTARIRIYMCLMVSAHE